MVVLPLLRILTPTVLKARMKYVFEKNELDEQMESVRARLDYLENKINEEVK